MSRQSGFAQLMLALAGCVKEVRLTIEEQQAEAARRERVLRAERVAIGERCSTITSTQMFRAAHHREPEIQMGITLLEVQRKVQLAVAKRAALLELANAVSPFEQGLSVINSTTMESCLGSLLAIRSDIESLHRHMVNKTVVEHTTLEADLRAAIAALDV